MGVRPRGLEPTGIFREALTWCCAYVPAGHECAGVCARVCSYVCSHVCQRGVSTCMCALGAPSGRLQGPPAGLPASGEAWLAPPTASARGARPACSGGQDHLGPGTLRSMMQFRLDLELHVCSGGELVTARDATCGLLPALTVFRASGAWRRRPPWGWGWGWPL